MRALTAFGFLVLLFAIATLAPTPVMAAAAVVARVDISSQRMTVFINGRRRYSWAVSTGAGRYRTPTGSYRPTFMDRKHYSRKYNNSPMPYSVFFRGGYAVHGTYSIRRLGRPASHGCVRLHPANAAKLFGLVQRYGKRNSRIIVVR